MNHSIVSTTPKVPYILGIAAILALALSRGVVLSQEKPASKPADQIGGNIPVSSIERAEKDGTAYPATLRDLTKLALENNLDIAISDTNEEVYQYRLLQVHGPYDPGITFTLGARSTTQPNTNLTNQSTQGNSNNTKLDTWNAQFTQNLLTGGTLVASLNSNRSVQSAI
jgi:hypothetical protein